MGYINAMRPLSHPSIQDITVEGILYAFSDPVRVQIFAGMQSSGCPKTCSNFLMLDDRKLPKSTLSQHFKILRESGLIRSERKGVEMHNTTRCMELKERFGPLISAVMDAYRLQRDAEILKNRKTEKLKLKRDLSFKL